MASVFYSVGVWKIIGKNEIAWLCWETGLSGSARVTQVPYFLSMSLQLDSSVCYSPGTGRTSHSYDRSPFPSSESVYFSEGPHSASSLLEQLALWAGFLLKQLHISISTTDSTSGPKSPCRIPNLPMQETTGAPHRAATPFPSPLSSAVESIQVSQVYIKH